MVDNLSYNKYNNSKRYITIIWYIEKTKLEEVFMSKLRKILIICLTVCCVILSVVALAACGGSSNYKKSNTTEDGRYDKNNTNGDLPFYYPHGSDPSAYDDPNNSYIIHTTSLGGLPINGVKITVSRDGVTVVEGRSANGGVKFGLPEGNYDLSYSDLPNGYFKDDEATLKTLGEEHEVTTAFGSAVIKATAPGNFYYNLGDVIYDFRVTDTEDNAVVLSELLKTKKLVVLNLWFTGCTWCLNEFPALNKAYNMYKDNVEIVALAPRSQGDSPATVKGFKQTFTYDDTSSTGQDTKRHLDFILAFDSAEVIDHFNVAGYPTSIFVDRYGVIAYAEPQAQLSPNVWADNFAKFTADDYKQNADNMGSIGGGDQTATSATPPPANIAPLPSSEALTEALLDHSMLQGSTAYPNLPLSFRGPNPDIEEEADDAYRSWPFHISHEEGLPYIYPSNTGNDTNNTFSILFTSVELYADQTLSLEVKLKTESNSDLLRIYMNRSLDNYYSASGNTGGWTEVSLFTATRYVKMELMIMYVKSPLVTEEDEFVGLRNLKITKVDENSPEALDIRTEVAREVEGVMTYKSIYLGDDGFYRVYQVAGHPEASDPFLLVDVLGETLWSDLHLPKYSLISYDGASRIKSLYNICYWLYNRNVESDQTEGTINNKLVFGDMGSHSDAIVDSYYIQSDSISLVPVNEKVKAALEKFVQIATTHTVLGDYYEGDYTSDTWLELCSYYRATGQGDHTAENHTCLATTNPALGKILEYAIPLHEGVNSLYSKDSTMKNRLGGLFYEFKAEKTGVYKFESLYEYVEGDPLDPKIVIWDRIDVDPFAGDRPILEIDDSLSYDRMKTHTTNFKLFIYLTAGQTIYPQLTTSSSEALDVYTFDISYVGPTHYELQMATTGEGMWEYYDYGNENYGDLYYISVPTVYDKQDDLYYHRIGSEQGSVMYIDFLMPNFYDHKGHSIKELIDNGAFDFSDSLGVNYTDEMLAFYDRAISNKSQDDPTYGMVEANSRLVQLVTIFARLNGDGDETVENGIWKAFAYYWEYYGPTAWEDRA